MAAPTVLRRAPAPTAQYVPFLRLEDYSAGGIIPDGDYLLIDFAVVLFTPKKKDGTIAGPERLSVRVTFDPPNGAQAQEDRKEQHYSMGTKAHLSYMPDPANGKRLIAVENGPAASLYETSNWHIFLKSLYDSGLPPDLAIDDLTALEGMVVHVKSVPEPESRKELRTQNIGEVAQDQRERKIPIITEIIAAPWMQAAVNGIPQRQVNIPGSIGKLNMAAVSTDSRPLPPGRPALPVRPSAGAYNALPVAPPPTQAPVAQAPPTPQADSETAVATAILTAMGNYPNGTTKLALQTATFRLMAEHPQRQEIMNTYFTNDDVLSALLNQMGYGLAAGKVAVL